MKTMRASVLPKTIKEKKRQTGPEEKKRNKDIQGQRKQR
jgi:hypothetical protein